ncbi:MAG: 16S rRNA (cytosine(1402)-N(4))-methyltransferase RsmH [Chitinophagaceae bacterium]|nr:16S rRNA (cytosine(1402)-N(4))-methyltransferase RsmH [Chitinophagaceae bacterium]MBK9570294.1 16S rRNA (cytosine(1402)-N(4))-methyltransferase RsmH [Chitinophagaceae bacterium]MBL0131959.1 16S rRNA (cytosine(1402)-N(4))-methyltransferase RsmH [Chitinophagaceae bacterium]MBL0271999.1 16S rRNA (cytosine(1402)-N(4))-methyltransferase RsmH [Chitinophagaceae bacterium]
MSDGVYHVPVLLNEVIEGLHIKPEGIYVDCTFGGGGHSRAILEKLSVKGKLVAFDQDEEARKNLPAGQAGLPNVQEGLPVDERITFIPQNFRHLQRFLRLQNITSVDGILADLGVSSHQFDEAGRGFSTRYNAELDMRMDQRQSLTAFEVVNTYTEQRLHKIFEQYGEVTNAKTLARKLVAVRSTSSLKTIDGFKNALREIVKGNPNKYFAQVFQALRIEVNDELGALKEMLLQIPSLLKPGGRAAIITFHSLEDRLVKNFFRRGSFDEPEQNPFTNTETVSELKIITRKPVVPTEEELKKNPRSRSAKLRVAEKVMMV